MTTVKREPSPSPSPAATSTPAPASATATATATATTTTAPGSDEKYWLVRVPSFIMSEFRTLSARGPGTQLGSIVIDRNITTTPNTKSHTKQNTDKDKDKGKETAFPQMRLVVSSADRSVPRECNLHIRPKKRSMLAFVDRGESDKCKLQAIVDFVADANPVDGEAYRGWLAKRLERSTIKTHVAKKIDESQHHTKLLPHAIHAQQQVTKRPRVAPRERRVASHASAVEDMVYRAFDKKPFWTLKELLKETNQPKPALLAVLNELCDRESKGDLIHNFKLKPQFRVAADQNSTSTTTSTSTPITT